KAHPMASALTTHIAKLAQEHAGGFSDPPTMAELNNLLRLLSRWRSHLLANTNIAKHGARILGGPFAGMEYVSAATEGALVPRLLGTYEMLSRSRSHLLANTYIAKHGARILGGPFAGMEYVSAATEGALVPRLLGTYESELHPHLQAFAEAGLDCVVDVGCAEGYYAVGLARMMPEV